MSESRIRDLLRLSYVSRWAIVPMLRPQSVAEHSFRVAAIAWEIAGKLGHPRANAVIWAIWHDGAEAESGDTPSTFKRQVWTVDTDDHAQALAPWRSRPDMQVVSVVKAADIIEALTWAERWCAEGGHPTKFEVVDGLRVELDAYLQRHFTDAEQASIMMVIEEMEGA